MCLQSLQASILQSLPPTKKFKNNRLWRHKLKIRYGTFIVEVEQKSKMTEAEDQGKETIMISPFPSNNKQTGTFSKTWFKKLHSC